MNMTTLWQPHLFVLFQYNTNVSKLPRCMLGVCTVETKCTYNLDDIGSTTKKALNKVICGASVWGISCILLWWMFVRVFVTGNRQVIRYICFLIQTFASSNIVGVDFWYILLWRLKRSFAIRRSVNLFTIVLVFFVVNTFSQ